MGRTVKFVGLFFIFMFTGAFIAGLVMGSFHEKETFIIKTSPETCLAIVSDTTNLKSWMMNIEAIIPTNSKNIYKLKLSNGKGESAVLDLEIIMDTATKKLVYEINNRGSKLETIFSFEAVNAGTNVIVEHKVKGKGIANKLVLAMLNKSLKKQYELETNRIKQLLEGNEIK